MSNPRSTLDLPFSQTHMPHDGALPESEWTGPRCEKCQYPIKSRQATVCRHCGWYALLGTFMEVDPACDPEHANTGATQPSTIGQHVQVWLNLLPRWAWWMIGCVALVVGESVAVRLATPAGSSLRTAWALGQLAIGAIVVAVCHLTNFLSVASDDTDISPLDLLIKPIKLWSRTIRNLPERFWRVNAAASGLMAVIMVFLVIGGLPYERLWDWGFKAPPKQNLAGAVMSEVQKGAGEGEKKPLDEAVGDLAGSADGTADAAGSKKPVAPPKPRKKMECVILGYLAHDDGRVHTLLLGTEIYGKLAYAGSVYPKLNEAQLIDLSDNLASMKTNRRLLPVQSAKAVWVEPKLVCRVTYTKQESNGRLTEIGWDEMVGQLKF